FMSRIDARNGVIALVPPALDVAIITNDFLVFEIDKELAEPRFLDPYFGTATFVEQCQRASEGTTNRVRLQLDRFLNIDVPLPSIEVQRSIVARIEHIAAKIEHVRCSRSENQLDSNQLLKAAYWRIAAN